MNDKIQAVHDHFQSLLRQLSLDELVNVLGLTREYCGKLRRGDQRIHALSKVLFYTRKLEIYLTK